ncbi:hypothetical protein DBB_8450 [Desulfoluna spongiiphila]|nr:hypothetical protein DBB_8450 [Desulfoluna spongiiphila]
MRKRPDKHIEVLLGFSMSKKSGIPKMQNVIHGFLSDFLSLPAIRAMDDMKSWDINLV